MPIQLMYAPLPSFFANPETMMQFIAQSAKSLEF